MRTFAKAGRVLGDLEERLMGVLWRGAPLTVRDACGRKEAAGLAYTTVMTTLDRLHKKGLLARERQGNAFVYSPAMTRDEYHRRIVEQAVGGMLATSGDPVLAAFVDTAATVDERNLARLERLIAARRGRR